MRFSKLFGFGLVVGSLVFGASDALARPHLPPPPPGMVICPRCDGHRRVPSGFLGWKEKRCPECRGTGAVARRHHHKPAPPPPRAHKPAPPPPPPGKGQPPKKPGHR